MYSTGAAVRHLKRADPDMARIIDAVGPCRLRPQGDPFAELVSAILHQQLALPAARRIESRFLDLYPRGAGRRRAASGRLFPGPRHILATDARRLRRAGLSRQKTTYLRDLSRRTLSGAIPLRRLSRMSDAEVIETVTTVKGIGRWTAEMLLIFCLGRADVLPVDDLGIQHAFKKAWRMRSLPRPARMHTLAQPWRPYRSVASWYLWRYRRLET